MLQLLCKILHVETACVTMIVDDGVLVKQGTGMLTQKKVYPQPGVCHWILVPDKPQTMIVEDMQEDARYVASLVRHHLEQHMPACHSSSRWHAEHMECECPKAHGLLQQRPVVEYLH